MSVDPNRQQPFSRALLDGFDGIRTAFASRTGRTMRIMLALLVSLSAGLWAAHVQSFVWLIILPCTGFWIALEIMNNVIERIDDRIVQIELRSGLRSSLWNEDSRFVRHQMTAAVLIVGILGVLAGVAMVLWHHDRDLAVDQMRCRCHRAADVNEYECRCTKRKPEP